MTDSIDLGSFDEQATMAQVFLALSDPNRLAIINLLSSSEQKCLCEIMQTFMLSQSKASYHMRILLDAKLVNFYQVGKWKHFYLLPQRFNEICKYLAKLTPQDVIPSDALTSNNNEACTPDPANASANYAISLHTTSPTPCSCKCRRKKTITPSKED